MAKMNEYRRSWQRHGQRMHLTVRAWRGGNPLRAAWRWLVGRQSRYRPSWEPAIEFELRTLPHSNGRCYCPYGSETQFRLSLFGWGFWGWLSRDRTPLPCWCDVVIWKVFDGYEEDVEAAGGWELLTRRFPDLIHVHKAD